MYLAEGLLSGPEAPMFAARLRGTFVRDLEEDKNADLSRYQGYADNFFKDYDEAVDQRLTAALFEYVYKNINPEYCPEFLDKANKKYKGNWAKYVADLYKASVFANQESLGKFMLKPNLKQIKQDALAQAGTEALEMYHSLNETVPQQSQEDLQRGIRDFTDGILQINAAKSHLMSPDANSTIRLTYGNVMSYDPKDGVAYRHYTTMKGIIEKEDPESSEFAVPARLKELYYAKKFGNYANKKGEMPTCFITNNDITGGNSGSPVINSRGVLIGLAFDGNSEAMSGDIDFEENLQRCICLDSRYMLWVIDVYAGAKNLIEEMDIVR